MLAPSTSSSIELASSQELRLAANGWEQRAGHGGGERWKVATQLSILPSAEYCLGKTMKLFFKHNLQENPACACQARPCSS